jgi:hypothetical protein
MDKPTPPRITSRAPGERPPDQRQCPGCATLIHFAAIACPPCWRTVPGGLKAQFGRSAPGSTVRARLVIAMRRHLLLNLNPPTDES